jgi:hypothetical protein
LNWSQGSSASEGSTQGPYTMQPLQRSAFAVKDLATGRSKIPQESRWRQGCL